MSNIPPGYSAVVRYPRMRSLFWFVHEHFTGNYKVLANRYLFLLESIWYHRWKLGVAFLAGVLA